MVRRRTKSRTKGYAAALVWVGACRVWLLLAAAVLLGPFAWLWYGDSGENFGPLLPGR